MEEILIEEKKYVSSKRAAKITGYAKDYIGQLCREGRVPARLVGRSWYVLESAIQDHRFGKEMEPMDMTTPVQPVPDDSMGAEEPSSHPEQITFPRYETTHVDVLPSLNRLTEVPGIATEDTPDMAYAQKDPQTLTESWNEWFEHVRGAVPEVGAPVQKGADAVSTADLESKEELPTQAQEVPIDVLESVPIHVVRPTAPSAIPQQKPRVPEESASTSHHRISRKGAWAIRIAGVLLAVVSVILSVAGSGYLDNYMTSYSQAQFIFGISTYNK